MGNKFNTIKVESAFEVSNGLQGMNRDVILRLCSSMKFKTKNIRSVFGISRECSMWKNHYRFVNCRKKCFHKVADFHGKYVQFIGKAVCRVLAPKFSFFDNDGVVVLKGISGLEKEDFSNFENFLNWIIAKSSSRLWSPYLLKYLCFYEKFDIFHVVMEVCDENLNSFLLKRKLSKIPLRNDKIKKMIGQLIIGMYILHHELKMVHGSIRTENILRLGDVWKISDYGIKAFIKKKIPKSEIYLAPELRKIKREKTEIRVEFTEKADICGLGLVFQQIVTVVGLVRLEDVPSDWKRIIGLMMSGTGKFSSILGLVNEKVIQDAISALPSNMIPKRLHDIF